MHALYARQAADRHHVRVPGPTDADARRLVALGAAAVGLGVVLIIVSLARAGFQLPLVIGAGAITLTGLVVALAALRQLRR